MPLVRCKGCGAQASVHPEELAVAGDYCPDCQPFEEATCDRCADPICPAAAELEIPLCEACYAQERWERRQQNP